MSIHEQARAEAERMAEHVWAAWTGAEGELLRGATIQGFLAGHEAATRARVVTTVTELDALPDRTCIIDADMEFHQRHGTLLNLDRTVESAWLGFLSPTLRSASELRLPARVLHDPEETR